MLDPEGPPPEADQELATLLASTLLRGRSQSGRSLVQQISDVSGDTVDAEQARAVLEAYYQALYARSTDILITLNEEGRIIAINESGLASLKQSEASLLGSEVSALLQPGSGAALVSLLWSGFEGISSSMVALCDGRQMRLSVAPLIRGMRVLIFRDATPFHQLEQELQHSRGLASVGHLAADLAHGISNPLAVIQGRVELLLSSPSLDPELVRRQLSILQEHCKRIGGIIENLQTIAAPRPLRRERVVLSDAIDIALQDLGRRRERIRIICQVAPPNLHLNADAMQLRQIFVNLFAQAMESTPKGRLVQITALLSDRQVRVSIEDEGSGLTLEQLDALETANRERTMPDPVLGLPMTIAWVLAREHGGQLQAENRLTLGARYRLSLPQHPPKPSQLSGEERHILVVDDNQMLCETVQWMLSREGYSIVAVHSAEDALRRIKRQHFDAILTDIRLPGMDGEELIDSIKERWPRLARRTILTSGLVYQPRHKNLYLQKPFTRKQLLQAIR